MVPTVVFLLLGLMITGALLALVGIRGRRINDHPVCRGCHFDLQGVYPGGITCPECGAGLKREHAVRIGARSKSVPLALLGLVLLAAPTVPIGFVGYTALTGTDINKFKPLGLLLWESNHAGEEQNTRIAAELMNRALKGALAPDQYARVIERTLDLQADLARPWSQAWGDLIERAKLDGVLTKSQDDRFISQMLPLEVVTRKTARAGSTIPLIIKPGEFRGGSSSSISTELALHSARIGGQPADAAAAPRSSPIGSLLGAEPSEDSTIATLSASGSRANGWLSTGSDPEGGCSLVIPQGLSPGTHDIELDLVRTNDAGGGGGGRNLLFIRGGLGGGLGRRIQNTPGAETRTTLKTQIRVVDDASATQPIAADEATTEKIRAALKPAMVDHGQRLSNPFAGGTGGPMATIDFGEASTPAPIAYDVFVKDGDQEHKIGTLTTGKTGPKPTDGLQSFFSSSFTVTINGRTTSTSSRSSSGDRLVSGPCPDIRSATVDVILKPSPAAAESTIDQTRYYDGEIVYKDVPVQRDPLLRMGDDPFQNLMPRIFQVPPPVIRRPSPG